MVVNAQMLIDHTKKYKMARDTCAEYYRQLFMKHPELAKYYDAEDLDPDSVPRSQKFMMQGAQELQFFFQLPQHIGDATGWRTALSNFKNIYSENNFPIGEFSKVVDAFLAAMEKHAGGVTADQKKNWEELFAKACTDMKSWEWC